MAMHLTSIRIVGRITYRKPILDRQQRKTIKI